MVFKARFSCLHHLLVGALWPQTSDFTHHCASGSMRVPASSGVSVWHRVVSKRLLLLLSRNSLTASQAIQGNPGGSDLAPFPSPGTDSICHHAHETSQVAFAPLLRPPRPASCALLLLRAPSWVPGVCLLIASSCCTVEMVGPSSCSSPPCFWTDCLG